RRRASRPQGEPSRALMSRRGTASSYPPTQPRTAARQNLARRAGKRRTRQEQRARQAIVGGYGVVEGDRVWPGRETRRHLGRLEPTIAAHRVAVSPTQQTGDTQGIRGGNHVLVADRSGGALIGGGHRSANRIADDVVEPLVRVDGYRPRVQ